MVISSHQWKNCSRNISILIWTSCQGLELLFTKAPERSRSQPRCENQDNSSSLWPKKKKQAGRRWVEYRKLLSPNIWTWAKSNNAKNSASFFLCLRARGCGDLWYFSGLNWKFNRTGRRCLGEWSSPASRNWQKNSPSSTTEASGCWPVFTISKRFAHTRSYINIKHTGLLTYSLCGQYLHLHPKRVSILTLETVWMLD